MKLPRKTAGCTLSDHNRNELTTEEIKITPTAEYYNNTAVSGYSI
jgi:hypothetical protein